MKSRIGRRTSAPGSSDGSGALTQRSECGAPGDHLVEHRAQGVRAVAAGLEDAEVLELGDQRERDLLAHVGHLQLAGHEAEVLGGARATDRPVGDEADRLVVPLGVEVVDRVLEHAGGAVVVLGRHHTNPSTEAIFCAHSLVWSWAYWASDG